MGMVMGEKCVGRSVTHHKKKKARDDAPRAENRPPLFGNLEEEDAGVCVVTRCLNSSVTHLPIIFYFLRVGRSSGRLK